LAITTALTLRAVFRLALRQTEGLCQRHPDAAVIVPPRSNAMPSATAETAPTKRDRHLQLIAERGRRPFTAANSDVAPARKSLRAKVLFTDNWCAPKAP